MGLPDLYPAQVGSPWTTLAAPYTTGGATMTVADATKLPDAPNLVCLAGSVSGEFRYSGKDGNTLLGVVKLPGTPNATWPAGTYAFRGIAAYDHASIVEHLTYQRSHIVEASLDLTTNHTYSGRVLEGAEAGENLAFGDLVVLAESGKFMKANPATLATLDGTIALVVSDTIAAGGQGMFLLRGLIRNDSWTFSQGKELYAGTGTLTHEPPAAGTQLIRKMGTAITSAIIEFNPSSTVHAEHLVSVLPVNTVSKDNNDIERKFWKDDFSVDSSDTWQLTNATYTVGTGIHLTDRYQNPQPMQLHRYGRFTFVVQQTNTWTTGRCAIDFQFNQTGLDIPKWSNGSVRIIGESPSSTSIAVKIYSNAGNSTGFIATGSDAVTWFASPHIVDVIYTESSVSVYIDGVHGHTRTATTLVSDTTYFGFYNDNVLEDAEITISNVSYAPPISYSDDFTSDTVSGANGRYQAVTGTVAYDDVNKRMTITAGAGVTAKTRLKSYTQLEGVYKRKLHLPATGTDGDVVAAYFGTDPTLESGFGIGAIRTAGVWNIATIDGATVTDTGTVIADLVDGDSFYVEVERDTTHGVVWYYVYKSGKPTTASGKLFNTYQEIYDGFWFKNNGAAENSIAVSEIEDRAESIVGRTNVQVEEPFWFRDEFREDSRGRLVNGTNMFSYDAVNDQIVKKASVSAYYPETLDCTSLTMEYVTPSDPLTGNMTLIINDSPPSILSTSGTLVNGYAIYFRNSVGQIVFRSYINGVAQPEQYLLREFVADEVLTVKFTKTDTKATVVISNSGGVLGTLTQDTNAALTNGKVRFVDIVAGSCGVRSIEFSGTRVYNKPIHRGSMLETYHEGTQEVVGTTYINDMNWNAGELTLDNTTGGSWAIDTTEGVLKVSTGATARAGCSIRNVKIIDGYWRFRFNTSNKFQFGILQQTPITDSSSVSGIHNGGGYILKLSDGFFELFTSMTTHLGTGALTLTYNANYLCEFIKTGNRFTLYLTDSNGIVQTATWTDPNNLFTTSLGVCNFYQHYPSVTTKIWDFVAIGIDSDATNGIAACIPPIGGGARYGVEESVYIPITPGTEIPVGSAVISPNAKSTVVGTALTTFAQTPAGVSASLEYATGTKACPGLSTAFAPTGRHRVKADRNTLMNIGVKGSVAGTSPTVYIDSLHVRKQEVA